MFITHEPISWSVHCRCNAVAAKLRLHGTVHAFQDHAAKSANHQAKTTTSAWHDVQSLSEFETGQTHFTSGWLRVQSGTCVPVS
jgi:hypothetical protein